jgi:hypothetical protein
MQPTRLTAEPPAPPVARFGAVFDELAVASLLLSAVALISCLSVEGDRRTRIMPRALWVTVILLVPLAGAVGWFGLGRPRALSTRRRGWRAAIGLREPPRPPAPDDDAAFLRSLQPPGDPPGPPDPR